MWGEPWPESGQERNSTLIGRPLTLSHVIGVGIVTASFVLAGFFTHPSSAVAAPDSPAPASAAVHTIALVAQGATTQNVTTASTVGAFLQERNIVVGPHDYVDPALDVPLSDGLVVTYRPAVAVTIVSQRQKLAATTSAANVAALLAQENVALGPDDRVTPPLSGAVPANGTVRITHVLTWERNERRTIVPQTIARLDFSLTPGTRRVIAKGSPGEREVRVRFVQRDGGDIHASIVASHLLRTSHPRIVAYGADEYEALTSLELRGVMRTVYLARSAMEMVATAYTAGCYGCSGITATGRPAGHGIVAVDPSVIPLGTRLFIPGYGVAIAGDTGGAIRGNRIDLGFNSERDAMLFGRREVTVYRLK